MGGSTSVCVVLKGDTEMGASMEQVEKNHLNGGRLQATLYMDDGTQHVLDSRSVGWSMFGQVVKRGELVACAMSGCGSKPPVGGTVARMTLSATQPVKTLGVYWESKTMPGEKADPKAPASSPAKMAPRDAPSDPESAKSAPRSSDQKTTRC
ncbi:MAG: hypothetical protein JNM76_09695 [Betaproteobacteria bacterium]|nr:hypothetical protein [Betaproteobacteria bacterium]